MTASPLGQSNMWWLGLTTGTVIVAAPLVARRLFARSSRSASELEVGNVLSENWLAEQRGLGRLDRIALR